MKDKKIKTKIWTSEKEEHEDIADIVTQDTGVLFEPDTNAAGFSWQGYDWQKNERPRKIMFAGDEVPFAWKNPLNIKSKRYSSIRKALREINNPKS